MPTLRKAFLPAALACLTGCAGLGTGVHQGASPLGTGGYRLGGSLGTGLHLEEAGQPPGGQSGILPLEDKPYVRPLIPDFAALWILASASAHAGYGVSERWELRGAVFGGVLGQGIQAGIRYTLPLGSRLSAAFLPAVLALRTDPEEPSDDEETSTWSFPRTLADKTVTGVEAPLLLGLRLGGRRDVYLVPSYSVYRVDIEDGYLPEMAGVFRAHRFGLVLGTSLPFDSRFHRPEIAFSLLDLPRLGRRANLNLSLGWSTEKRPGSRAGPVP